jgi:hypothetical protein
MKTAFQAYIEELEKNPNEVLTKANVIHHAKMFAELEKDQLIDMGNRYYRQLLKMGVVTQDGKEVFKSIYKHENP